jgi:putative N6-adenine-specific DNA methylase
MYRGIMSMDWSKYMNSNQTFVIDTTVHSDHFKHSQFVSQKCKDAIVDQFRSTNLDNVPSIDKDYPDLRINIHIDKTRFLYHSTHRARLCTNAGTRRRPILRPSMKCSLQECCYFRVGTSSDFLDPMCGSGTILAEAAMIACNIPANINRREFAFEKWNDWDNDLFDKIVDSLLSKVREFHYTIKGYDKAPSAVLKSKDNIRNANLEEYITVQERNFFDTQKETSGPLHVLLIRRMANDWILRWSAFTAKSAIHSSKIIRERRRGLSRPTWKL